MQHQTMGVFITSIIISIACGLSLIQPDAPSSHSLGFETNKTEQDKTQQDDRTQQADTALESRSLEEYDKANNFDTWQSPSQLTFPVIKRWGFNINHAVSTIFPNFYSI